MCKIIQFPKNRVQKVQSNGYMNLTALFEVCNDVAVCNEYLNMVEYMRSNEQISENEMLTLRRIGRQKRIELANPKKEAPKSEKPGTYLYTPEMGEERPKCDIEAQMSFYGSSHYHLKTALELKGRGIKKDDSYSYEDGLNRYTVTKLAYEKLQKIYTVSYKCALD